MASESNPVDVPAILQEIQDTLGDFGELHDQSLPSGAKGEDLQKLEKRIGVRLPQEFKEFYFLHDGSLDICIAPNFRFLPAARNRDEADSILKTWQEQCEVWEWEDDDEPTEPVGPIRPVRWHPKWIPFGDNWGGDYICLDFAPADGGKMGQVIDWGHELGPERVLAESFAEYLLDLPQALREAHQAEEQRRLDEARTAREKFAANGCWGSPKLSGKTLFLRKDLDRWNPSRAHERIQAEGGTVSKQLDTSVDYLVVAADHFVKRDGDTEIEFSEIREPCPEQDQAQKLNEQGASISILMEHEFAALLSPTREELLALLLSRPDPDRWEWLTRDIPLPTCRGLVAQDADLSHLDMQLIDFTGADLQRANLTRAQYNVRDGNLDGACLVDSHPMEMINSSLRNVDMSDVRLCHGSSNLSGCDLTGANMTGAKCSSLKAKGATLHDVDLTGCSMERIKFAGADLTGAILAAADLQAADLSHGKLRGANLAQADLTRANLIGADLTNADLSHANLALANLSGAIVDGANFEGANLSGANLDDVNTEGLAAHSDVEPITVGPKMQRLAEVSRETKSMEILAEASLGEVTVGMQINTGDYGANGYQSTRAPDNNRSWPLELGKGGVATMEECLLYLAQKWQQADFDPKSIRVRTKKCPLKTKELKELVAAAFREMFS